jgi:hypothetical protein
VTGSSRSSSFPRASGACAASASAHDRARVRVRLAVFVESDENSRIRILGNFSNERPVVWLALAATQWKTGHVVPKVVREAIKIIDSGSSLSRFEVSDRQKRQNALTALRSQLTSPPSAPKRIPKTFRDDCDWKIGEVVVYTTKTGRRLFFWVVGYHEDEGGRAPVCELFAWRGRSMPTKAQLKRVGSRRVHYDRGSVRRAQFMIGRTSERELPATRVLRTDVRMKPVPKLNDYWCFLWSHLDELLRMRFNIR